MSVWNVLQQAKGVGAAFSRLATASIVSKYPEGCTTPTIGTHDGTFHCDEALACAILLQLPAYQGATIVRSRKQDQLDQCDIVVDVGAVYDHEKKRYDHHQKTFTETLAELGHSIKLSASGLVYRHYGPEIISVMVDDASAGGAAVPQPVKDMLYRKLYKSFFEHIDGIDNGVEAFRATEGLERNYQVSTTLSSRVGSLNPRWNEDGSSDARDARFLFAMQLAVSDLAHSIDGKVNSWWPCRAIVESAIDAAPAAHPSGLILVLDQYCPWSDHLFDIEEERKGTGIGRFTYVLYPDSGGMWRVQAVPECAGSFASRKALPQPWRGVRDEALSEVSGIPGGTFVHAAGFIGGNQTKEGALAMAAAGLAFEG